MKINVGLTRVVGKKRESKNVQFEFSWLTKELWDGINSEAHRKIRRNIISSYPGWSIMGYAPSRQE